MRIVLLGMNHRSAPLELREQLAVDDPAPPLQKLLRSDEIDEAGREEGMAYLEAARVLFGLDDDVDPAGGR